MLPTFSDSRFSSLYLDLHMVVDRLLESLRDPLLSFSNPQRRIFWLFLLGSFVVSIAGAVIFSPSSQRSFFRAKESLSSLFSWSIFSHRSALLDYQLMFAKAAVRTLLIAPWVVSTITLTRSYVGFLQRTCGISDDFANLSNWSPQLVMTIYTIVMFVAWDFSRYLMHRLFHEVPWLWEFHKLHHSAEVLTPFTLYRSHPIESIAFRVRGVFVVVIVTGTFFYFFRAHAVQYKLWGINAIGFVFNFLGANLRHSHVWISYGHLVERMIISPAQHQIHHSTNPTHFGKNYGTWLSFWDAMFGSLLTTSRKQLLTFGLSDQELNHHPHRLGSALWGPLRSILRRSILRWSTLARKQTILLVPILLHVSLFCQVGHAQTEPVEAIEQRADDGEPEEVIDLSEDDKIIAAAPVETYHTSEVDVTSLAPSRSKVVAATNQVSEDELDAFEDNDVHRVLSRVPGVYVRGEDGYGLRPNIGMRGANSDRSAKITLMEDGVLLAPAPYAAPAAYYFPLMTRMVGLDVYKGAPVVQFGPSTISGAIDLKARDIISSSKIKQLEDNNAAATQFGDLSVGSNRTLKLHGAISGRLGHASGGNLGGLIEALRLQTNGFKQIDGNGPQINTADTGFVRNTLRTKLSYNTDPNQARFHELTMQASYADEQSNETYLGLTQSDFDQDPYRRYAGSARDVMRWWRTQVRADYTLSLASGIDVSATAYRNDFFRDWTKASRFASGATFDEVLANPNAGQSAVLYGVLAGTTDSQGTDQQIVIGANRRHYVSQGVQLKAHVYPTWSWIANSAEIGLRLHQDGVKRKHLEDNFAMIRQTLVPQKVLLSQTGNTGAGSTIALQNSGSAFAVAAHVKNETSFNQSSVDLLRRLLIFEALRVESIRTASSQTLPLPPSAAPAGDQSDSRWQWGIMPAVGIDFRTTDWLHLTASYHHGFSPVSPGQDSSVEPERSHNYELGGRVASHIIQADVTGFFNDYGNIKGECSASKGCLVTQLNQQFNGGKVHIYGLEAKLSKRLQLPWDIALDGQATYTLTASRFRTSFSSANPLFGDVDQGDALAYIPVHQGSLSLGIARGPLSLNASLAYVGDMRNVAGQGEIMLEDKIPGYTRLDATLRYTFANGVSTYLVANNLSGNSYMTSLRPFGARPGMPLQILLGLKFDAI